MSAARHPHHERQSLNHKVPPTYLCLGAGEANELRANMDKQSPSLNDSINPPARPLELCSRPPFSFSVPSQSRQLLAQPVSTDRVIITARASSRLSNAASIASYGLERRKLNRALGSQKVPAWWSPEKPAFCSWREKKEEQGMRWLLYSMWRVEKDGTSQATMGETKQGSEEGVSGARFYFLSLEVETGSAR